MFKTILHNVFQSSMHALTIRYNDLNLDSFIIALILHFYVVKNKQETDSLGLSEQDIRLINFTGENR